MKCQAEHEIRESKTPTRETWTDKLDFLLASIGACIGLGNVWRFPYLCYRHGGGAFLIPYFICVVAGGIPLFFLEVAVGQFMGESGVRAWRICPLLQGIGWTITVMMFMLSSNYIVIMAWGLYYLFASFTSKLPWDSCDNSWNTEHCSLNFTGQHLNPTFTSNDTRLVIGSSNDTELLIGSSNESRLLMDPTTEYWERKVLGISDGIEYPGTIKWDLCLCLMLAWIIVYLCVCKGVRTSGKVVYFTATAPYVFMFVLLVRGCTLPGALNGILFYLVPDFKHLADMQVWIDAGTQVFYSYALGLGIHTALGSFNKFNYNSYKNAIILSVINSGTSIFAGFVIFSVLGHMAHVQNTTVDQVAESGPGLAFIVYPKAITTLPVAPLWSALFFFMLFLVGLDSEFVGFEALVTAFLDRWPVLRRKFIREGFVALMAVAQFLLGLTQMTNGGIYVFELFGYYAATRILALILLIQVIAIAYIYGVNRFYANIEMMLGFRINPYMKISWILFTPVYCGLIFLESTMSYSELQYRRPSGVYTYPSWAIGVGWVIAILPIVIVPGYAIYKAVIYKRHGKPLVDLLYPEDLAPHQMRPQDRQSHFEKAKMADSEDALPLREGPMTTPLATDGTTAHSGLNDQNMNGQNEKLINRSYRLYHVT